MEATTQNFIAQPERTDIEAKALSLPEMARALVIKDQAGFERGGQVLKDIKAMRSEINDTFDPIIKKAHEAHKEAVAKKKQIEAPLLEAEGIVKNGLAAYHEEQERIRLEAQRKAEEEAKKVAEEEQLAAALAAENDGCKEEAEAIINSPIALVRPIVPKAPTAAPGVSFRQNYSAEVIDLRALLRAIAEGKVPIQAIEANMTFLNQQARSLQTAFNFPGVRLIKTTNVAGAKR